MHSCHLDTQPHPPFLAHGSHVVIDLGSGKGRYATPSGTSTWEQAVLAVYAYGCSPGYGYGESYPEYFNDAGMEASGRKLSVSGEFNLPSFNVPMAVKLNGLNVQCTKFSGWQGLTVDNQRIDGLSVQTKTSPSDQDCTSMKIEGTVQIQVNNGGWIDVPIKLEDSNAGIARQSTKYLLRRTANSAAPAVTTSP